MVATPSTMLELGTKAPFFRLIDSRNREPYSLNQSPENGLLIAFICNHCPYVLHLLPHFIQSSRLWQEHGIEVVAISSNDIEKYPLDNPKKMATLATDSHFTFPYLFDESQKVAQAYRASCTPDFFLFDQKLKLFYRGQYDDSRPGNQKEVNGRHLNDAIDKLLQKESPPQQQVPSLGCNIKWIPGNEPDYFSA
jgi:peroxiredoxin